MVWRTSLRSEFSSILKSQSPDNENKHEEKSVSSKSSKKNLGESADLMAAIAALTDMHKVIANLIQSNEALVQQLKEVETSTNLVYLFAIHLLVKF